MPATLEDALSNAIAVLQDAGEPRRMPSGVPLDAEATTFMLDAHSSWRNCAPGYEPKQRFRSTQRYRGSDMTEQGCSEKIECPPHHEERLIEQAKAGTWDGEGSVSEVVTVALATDQLDRLPRPYTSLDSAWARLNERQHAIVRRYGRDIATVWRGGLDINREMVRLGFAWAYRKYLEDPSLLDDEAAARVAGRGL